MYELLLPLSIFLVFASLFSLAKGLLEWRANAETPAFFRLLMKGGATVEDDRVLPLEVAVQQALANRRIQEARLQ